MLLSRITGDSTCLSSGGGAGGFHAVVPGVGASVNISEVKKWAQPPYITGGCLYGAHYRSNITEVSGMAVPTTSTDPSSTLTIRVSRSLPPIMSAVILN